MHICMSSSAEAENNPVELNLSRSVRLFISGSQVFFSYMFIVADARPMPEWGHAAKTTMKYSLLEHQGVTLVTRFCRQRDRKN
jgi:hypothetical protein